MLTFLLIAPSMNKPQQYMLLICPFYILFFGMPRVPLKSAFFPVFQEHLIDTFFFTYIV